MLALTVLTEPSPKAMLQRPGCRLAKPPTYSGEPGLAGDAAVAADVSLAFAAAGGGPAAAGPSPPSAPGAAAGASPPSGAAAADPPPSEPSPGAPEIPP